MELAQGELLRAAGISVWDKRLRPWREVSLAAFERAWAKAASRGIDLREDQAGVLYACCLSRTMMREGIEAGDVPESDGVIKGLVGEVFF
jgi:predicted trehalose synthase